MPIQLPSTDKTLLEYLLIRHPYFEDHKKDWELYEQVRKRDVSAKDYLVKGTSESPDEFSVRQKLAVFAPETPMVVQRISGFLSRVESERNIPDDFDKFIKKADKRGQPLEKLLINVVERALWFHACYALIDQKPMPRDEEGNPITIQSRADAERYIGEPYIVLYSPLNIVNWRVATDGKIEWLVIREEFYHQTDPFDLREKRIQYRIFDQNAWAMVEIAPKRTGNEDKSKTLEADEQRPEQMDVYKINGEHNLGMVPVVPMIPFPDDSGIMTGYSFVQPAVRHDIGAWRIDSDYRVNLYIHNHPKFILKASADALQTFKTTSALHLNPTKDLDEKAWYESPPSEVFEHSVKAIENDKNSVWVQTYQDAASRITGGKAKEESGYHKRLSFEMAEGAILSHLTTKIVDFESQVFEVVARMKSSKTTFEDQEFAGQITRNKSYDIFWISDYLDLIEKSRNLIQFSPTLMAKAIRRITRALLDNPKPETVETIAEEVEGNRSLLTGKVEAIINRIESLRMIETPSAELIRTLYQEIATEILGENEELEGVLSKVLEELQEADINLEPQKDEFEERNRQETGEIETPENQAA